MPLFFAAMLFCRPFNVATVVFNCEKGTGSVKFQVRLETGKLLEFQ